MLPLRIENVDVAALQALVEHGVAEGKTIEYKRELPGGADSDKVPFLASSESLCAGLRQGVFPHRKMPWCAFTAHCFREKKRIQARMTAP